MIRKVCFLIFVVFIVSLTTIDAQEWIPDANLRHVVRAELGLTTEIPLTQRMMLHLTGLDASKRGISDITGLEYATNMTWLALTGNRISDLTPISGLLSLEGLWIPGNPVSELSPLSRLVNLRELDLGDCKISRVDALATLTKLEKLILHYNRITDITPLGNLTNLSELWLTSNLIQDITPLANLTQLRALRIQGNPIEDNTPLDGLSLEILEYNEFCELPRLSIENRMQDRDYPSVVSAWYDILNRPQLTYQERLVHHDLHFSPKFGLHFQRTQKGIELVGNLIEARRQRDMLLEMNPNMIFLLEVRMRDADPDSPFYRTAYDDNFPWIRDAVGNKVSGGYGEYTSFLIDFTHPDTQDFVVGQAIAASKCGLYDGIFLDFWIEDWAVLRRDLTDEVYRKLSAERQAREVILRRIRAEVGDDFLILVNPNRRKTPIAAPYINGLFMETVRDHEGGYTLQGLIEIESTLLWAEENLQEPQFNCLEGWGIETESPDSPANRRWMRVFTTMGLTFSDGYVLYITGIRHPIHEHDWRVFEITHKAVHDEGSFHNHGHDHYWYDFWDADLGQPVGEKAELYENRQGLFIREFTNGWAVYNRSGKTHNIKFPEQVSGVSSGRQEKIWHELADLDGEIYLRVGSENSPADVNAGNKAADVNSDGIVNVLDLVMVANAFGERQPDLNDDGVVNILDLVHISRSLQSHSIPHVE